MEDYLERTKRAADQQRSRFWKGLWADIAFLVLILILVGVNSWMIDKRIKNPDDKNSNTIELSIFIFGFLWMFFCWDVYTIVKNSMGIIGINKLVKIIPELEYTKSMADDIPTWMFMSGFFYDVMEWDINEYVQPLTFHLNKKKINLRSLNIRNWIWIGLTILGGFIFFITQLIYEAKVGFKSDAMWAFWTSLVFMILMWAFALGFLMPRLFSINKKVKLDDQKEINEFDYYEKEKIFGTQKVLVKFWNRDPERAEHQEDVEGDFNAIS